jgi:hypothetical protein
MIIKIKQAESDCKLNLSEKNGSIEIEEFDLDKLTNQMLIWKKEIRNPKLDITRLDEIIYESLELLKENKEKSFNVKNKLLNGTGCYFLVKRDDITNDLLGQLFINSYKSTIRYEELDDFIHNEDQPYKYQSCKPQLCNII